MNSKTSLWQFATDGLVGAVAATVGFGILWVSLGSKIGLFSIQGPFITELFHFYVLMFSFQNPFISPMSSVLLIGFISMGMGGRFLESITSRWSWIKPVLIISTISWMIGIVLFAILYNLIDSGIVAIVSVSAISGFLIASLAGMIFNPAKRFIRLIIGAVASTVVGCGVGFWIYIFQIP